jgi:hypothetical protein
VLSPIYICGERTIPAFIHVYSRRVCSRHRLRGRRRRRRRREEVIPELDVAPLDALPAGVRVDVGLLAEQREACLLDPVEKGGGLEADLDGDPVRLDQQLPDVQVVADPVLQKPIPKGENAERLARSTKRQRFRKSEAYLERCPLA